MTETCPHCPDGPKRRNWTIYVSPEKDHDKQPIFLCVVKSNGAHVSESDAEWLRQLIREARPKEVLPKVGGRND